MTLTANAPQRPGGRTIRWGSALVTLGFLIFLVGPVLVNLIIDWKWFGEVDFRGVFTTALLARMALFVIVGLVGGLMTFLAGWMAWRTRPDELDTININRMDDPTAQYRRAMNKGYRQVLFTVPLIAFILAGIAGQSNWQTVLLFLNGGSFGEKDPQFGLDYGFYAFDLPVFRMISGMLLLFTVVAFLFAMVTHYLLGGIQTGDPRTQRKASMTNAARVQLIAWAVLFFLLKAVSYWLDRYDLLGTRHQTFTGGSYTDINALLPAKIALTVIAVLVAAAFLAAIWLRNLRIPAIATAAMVLSVGIIGMAWPAGVEQFSVRPNRAEKEREYIERNIQATRYFYGIDDDKVTYERDWGMHSGDADKAAKEVADDAATISNVRLLDPDIISQTFTQQQQLRNFFGFPQQLAIDRYEVDGETRDFVVAAREIDPKALSGNQQDWINRHTVYTHGNGFVAAPANKVDEVAVDVGSSRGGYPVYSVLDLQSKQSGKVSGELNEVKVDQPRIYFGPVIADSNADYAIVGAADGGTPVEYDTDGSEYTYTGQGGVGIGNIVDKSLFALKYGEMNLLLSDRIGSESKIIFDRDPRDRVQKVAPWLTLDSKTYPTVVDGRIKWVVDGYTTLRNMPYSQRTSLQDTTEDSLNPDGTRSQLPTNEVSYIRNSVKATVDAYDGTVTLYEFDEKDPVLKAWQKVYPDAVKPKSEISAELQKHLRYPEDMFKVQRELMARYHVSDPGVFFTNDAFWSVPKDPTASEGLNELNQPPYYVMAADPKTGKSSFQLITSFRGLNREFLSAHMAVSSDPDNYGHITVRALPTNTQTLGPKQAQDTMMSSDQIARDQSLWSGSNELKYGNLLTLPVGDGKILYAEPLFSQRKDQKSAFPKLLRVLVSYDGKVGYAPTIAEALQQVGIDPSKTTAAASEEGKPAEEQKKNAQAKPDADKNAKTEEADKPKSEVSQADRDAAVKKLNDALAKFKETQKSGSFSEQGAALDALDKAVQEYQNLENK